MLTENKLALVDANLKSSTSDGAAIESFLGLESSRLILELNDSMASDTVDLELPVAFEHAG